MGFSVSLPRMKNMATIVANRPKARTTSGKKIQASGFGQPALSAMTRRPPPGSGADVLGSRRLEEISAAAGAVADVVTDEVGNEPALRG